MITNAMIATNTIYIAQVLKISKEICEEKHLEWILKK